MNARDALADAVTTALSDMTFLDAALVDTPDTRPPTSHLVLIAFSRPVRGHITLYLSLGCKHAVAENVFGREWDALTASQVDDCLLELGNVIAGNFLTAYTGQHMAHDISLPEIRFDDGAIGCEGEQILASFDAEGCPLSASLCLESPVRT